MNKLALVKAETVAEGRSFLRRRTAVFFTFLFPVIVVGIFGFLIQSESASGVFSKPRSYYVPAYLAVVVVLTPLSRVGSTVARHRSSSRFEKLATTPLRRVEWLLSHTLVNVGFIGLAATLLFGVFALAGDVSIAVRPLLLGFLVVGIALFCALGAILGSLAGSQDGVIAASNGIGIPILFLSETFVGAAQLPAYVRPFVAISPLTYFARGVRAITSPATGGTPYFDFVLLTVVTAVAFLIAVVLLPWTE